MTSPTSSPLLFAERSRSPVIRNNPSTHVENKLDTILKLLKNMDERMSRIEKNIKDTWTVEGSPVKAKSIQLLHDEKDTVTQHQIQLFKYSMRQVSLLRARVRYSRYVARKYHLFGCEERSTSVDFWKLVKSKFDRVERDSMWDCLEEHDMELDGSETL